MKFLNLLWRHRTKLIGYLSVVIGALAVADQALVKAALGEDGLRWVLLSNGLLTALVGHANTMAAKRAARVKQV